jgi:hypothetical protein
MLLKALDKPARMCYHLPMDEEKLPHLVGPWPKAHGNQTAYIAFKERWLLRWIRLRSTGDATKLSIITALEELGDRCDYEEVE